MNWKQELREQSKTILQYSDSFGCHQKGWKATLLLCINPWFKGYQLIFNQLSLSSGNDFFQAFRDVKNCKQCRFVFLFCFYFYVSSPKTKIKSLYFEYVVSSGELQMFRKYKNVCKVASWSSNAIQVSAFGIVCNFYALMW